MADRDVWREPMVGTLSFDDHDEQCQHSVDLADGPER
jgi:hypothetical protein